MTIDRLLRAGVDVVRLNLSHGPLEQNLERLRRVRVAAERLGVHTAVLADLPGPKVRAGAFPDGGVFWSEGAEVRLVPGEGESGEQVVNVDYDTLLDDVSIGDRVVIGDGAICLCVDDVRHGAVHTRVITGGRTQGRPGVHLPAERLRITAPTDADLVLAKSAAAAGIDFIAVSFVRGAADIERVRAAIRPSNARLVAKIETMPAVLALPEIVATADAVMVARGDLGIECPLEDVPHLQKRIVRHCVEAGVPVITATQMLESMITAPSPTRAEVSDVANAVFDGTDAVMLSAETAIGHDPVGVVETMSRVAVRAEAEANYVQWASRLGRETRRGSSVLFDVTDAITFAITHAAWQAAIDVDASAILCCTSSGRTARAMARFRPLSHLVALSHNPETLRAASLSWGVRPILVDTYTSTDELVWFAVERAVEAGFTRHGDVALVLAGAPARPSGAATDVLRVVRVE